MTDEWRFNFMVKRLDKTHIHPWIDKNLDYIMEIEVKSIGITKQDFVALCIAEKLGISLNDDYMMDETYCTELRIESLENQIRDLELKKECLEKKIKGD